MSQHTVTVNGTVYDRKTGLPVRVEREVHNVNRHEASAVHVSMQKSRTLHRKYVAASKPAPTAAAHPHAIAPRKPAPQPLVSRSESISRFAKAYNTGHTVPKKAVMSDIAPAHHPIAHKVAQRTAKPQVQRILKPSQIIKQEAIADAMARTPATRSSKPHHQPKGGRFTRALSVASASLALLLLGGYFTYLTMPQISTRVAAAQAGINASYPAYQPSGYSLSGPVAYKEGNVSMKFAANAGPQDYTLSQSKSGWDSSAVLDNYVTPAAGTRYTTTSSNGLTIYTYGTNAVWVNGGILYTISGNAPLSPEQVQRIATSL
jgi:hypothetical protein